MNEPASVALLVEDEPHIRRFVHGALEQEGWHVHEAEGYRRGLIEAGTRKPDLVILDLGLPDGDGVDFIGELLARVRASQRRQRAPAADAAGQVSFGDVTVDLQNRRVTKAGAPVRLTPTEHRLLAVLVTHAGKVMTTPQLLRAVWGPNQAENGHYLRIYMGHLRHKLEDQPAQPRYLITETGVGYRLQLT